MSHIIPNILFEGFIHESRFKDPYPSSKVEAYSLEQLEVGAS